jgi:CBS domain-containing protein
MTKEVVSAAPTENVASVADKMRDRALGLVPVCDEVGRALGTITDRDLAIRVLSERRDPSRTRAEEVMSRDLVTCRPDDLVSVAERLMARHKKSRILCTEVSGRLVGVISLSDLAEHADATRATQVLREIAHREAHVELA